MNTIQLAGRLTDDPKFVAYKNKKTGEEAEIAKFSLAVTRPGTYGDTEVTDFFNVASYHQAKFIHYLRKGQQVGLNGVMTYRKYPLKDKDGNETGKNGTTYEVIADNVERYGSRADNTTEETDTDEPAKTSAKTSAKTASPTSADDNDGCPY